MSDDTDTMTTYTAGYTAGYTASYAKGVAAERALADRLAEALRLAMAYVRPHAPLGSAPQIEGETALAAYDAARAAER